MLQYLFDNVWVFNAGYDLHPPAALVTLLYFNAKDALQPLRPEKNSASSNRPYSSQIARPAPIHVLASPARHTLSTYSAADGRPERKPQTFDQKAL